MALAVCSVIPDNGAGIGNGRAIAGGRDLHHRPLRATQEKHPHDALRVGILTAVRERHLARESRSELNELRRRSRVKAKVVHDLELLSRAIRSWGAITHGVLLEMVSAGASFRATSRCTVAISMRRPAFGFLPHEDVGSPWSLDGAISGA